MKFVTRIVLPALAILAIAGIGAGAQSPDPDANAMAAFKEMVDAYRARPALTVKATVKIGLKQGETVAREQEVSAEFILAPSKTGIVKLRGFTCYMANGELNAIHEKNDNAYFSTPDDGAPYYALLTNFIDMPFPELALGLGEDAIDDVVMQFHPRAPWARPTAVEVIDVEGKQLQRIRFSSDFEQMDVLVDPATKLIQSVELNITGGDLAQQGATLTYKHNYEYQAHDQPLDPATLKFDPGNRQRVDLMAALPPAPQPREAGGGEAGDGEVTLEGKPAPVLVLATADGKAVDLADLKGKVVVLDFWATWCPPCRAALPMLHEVAKWATEEQLPVEVITVNVWEIRNKENDSPDARLASVRKFWEERKFTLPIAMDYTDEVVRSYGVSGIPTTVVIRSDGTVFKVHVGGGGDYAETLKSDIKEALTAAEAPKVEDDEPN
jgi:thiol-disulfide isomerase/thioredoxin